MGLPLVGDLLNSTVGKVVGRLVDNYLPGNMSDAEKAKVKNKAQELLNEEQKAISSQVDSINATIQAEINSGNKFISSWRPLCGYSLALMVLNNYILLPYFQTFGLQPIDIPVYVWTALLAVCGITSYTRGLEKVEKIKKLGEKLLK